MRRFAPLFVLIGLLAFAQVASATPPTPVAMTLTADFSGPVIQGTFTASSPLCSSGTFFTEVVAGGGGAQAFAFTGRQHMTCDDGSGTFVVQFHPQSNPVSPIPGGPWAALGGTDAYAGIHGAGSFSDIAFPSPTAVIALFTGEIHGTAAVSLTVPRHTFTPSLARRIRLKHGKSTRPRPLSKLRQFDRKASKRASSSLVISQLTEQRAAGKSMPAGD